MYINCLYQILFVAIATCTGWKLCQNDIKHKTCHVNFNFINTYDNMTLFN